MIDGDCQSTSFDELLNFGKERQKATIGVFVSISMEKAANDELRSMAKLKLARDTILGFRTD